MGNNQNAWIIGVIALLVGGLLTYGIFPRTLEIQGETKYIDKEVIKYVNQTTIVENEVANANLFLTEAIRDAWVRELSDDEKFLTCDEVEYDDDEVSLNKVLEWSYTWLDEDEYSVSYKAKYRFDSSDDDDRCSATRTIEVFYEDGEKPIVSWK